MSFAFTLYNVTFLLVSLFITYHLLRKLQLFGRYCKVERSNFPPGKRGMLPFVGETLHFLAAVYSKQGFYKFVQVRHMWYGKCFKTHTFGETHVFVSSTEAAKEILSNDLGRYTKKYIRSIGEVIGPESLLCAPHQTHKLIRRQLLDLFSSASIEEFIKQFDQTVVSAISSWRCRPKVIVVDEALEMTSKAMCNMLVSLEDGCELDMLKTDISCVCGAMLAFPLKFPWTRFSKGLKARRRIMDILERMVQKRRETDSAQGPATRKHKDSLDYLLQAPNLTDTQIKDNILTMIIAGQETTASAIAWMVKYLDENQLVLKALQDELQFLHKKIGRKPYLTLEDLNDMSYASKVVRESLRMASIVPWFPRVALYDSKIQGYTIKKGWNVNVDARAIHFDPTLFSDPCNFNPTRFDDDAKPYSFLAFGAGGRTCIGMNLAKAMMLVFLYRFVTTCKWKVIDSDSTVEKWTIVSRLKSGCPIEVTHVYD